MICLKKIISVFFFICFFITLYEGALTFSYCKEALFIWFEKLVPSMFVSMVLIRMMYKLQLLDMIRFSFFSRIFHIDMACIPLVLCAIFLGFPSGSIFIDEAYGRGEINEAGAKRLLYSCSFATAGFVVMSCGVAFYQSIHIGFSLYGIQILSGLLLLFGTRKTAVISYGSQDTKKTSMMQAMSQAIKESGIALYMIGGYLLLFMSILAVLLQVLPEEISLPIRIISEFSSGSVLINQLPFCIPLRMLFTSMLLSFGGCCVHMQVFSMIQHTSMSYPKFLLYRIVQVLISIFLCFLFYLFLN